MCEIQRSRRMGTQVIVFILFNFHLIYCGINGHMLSNINHATSNQDTAFKLSADACLSYPCLNGATCETTPSGYNCTCAPGFTGNNCGLAIFECASSPCVNGGSCVDGDNSYRCVCVPGYTGLNCQTAINECSSVPCQNSATCVDGDNRYTCSCLPGYSGVNCQFEPCSFYITESAQREAVSGYISKVDEYGNVIRLTTSGDCFERSIARDGSLLFYSLDGNTNLAVRNSVWRVSTDNPGSTRVMIWQSQSDIEGMTLTKSDRRLFVDLSNSLPIMMLDYNGNEIASLNMTKTTLGGLATDETNRILYFTMPASDSIYSVSYTSSAFTGIPTVILSGSAVGQVGDSPTGIVYDSGEKLYWILQNTREIRSMTIGSASSEVIVPVSDSVSGPALQLAKCGANFYYGNTVIGGIWRADPTDSSRVVITTSNTLATIGITVA